MSGYTPGPWSVFGDPNDHPGIEADDLAISVVVYGEPCEVEAGIQGRTSDEAWANARLIAAAPDLLEALEALEMRVRVVVGAHAPELKGARAAIAKARGSE